MRATRLLLAILACLAGACGAASAQLSAPPAGAWAPTSKGAVTYNGRLELSHIHRPNGNASRPYWAIATRRSLIPVEVNRSLLARFRNRNVSATGVVRRGMLRVTAMRRTKAARRSTIAGGPRKVAMILVYPSDEIEGFDEANITDFTYNAAQPRSLANYYATSTFGHITFSGSGADVFGPLPVTPNPGGYPPGACPLLGAWSNEATNLITPTRPNFFAEYDHYVYVTSTPRCSSMGGAASQGGVNVFLGSFSDLLIDHEIGHNLNLFHASTVRCDVGGGVFAAYVPGCDAQTNPTFTEYEDPFDPMGGNGLCNLGCELNAPHKASLGALGTTGVQSVTYSGTYSIAPLETSTGVRMIRIATGNGRSFDFSVRRPIGFFDQGIYNAAWFGVYVHSSSMEHNDNSILLDMHPNTPPEGTYWRQATPFHDAAMQAGESFSVSSTGLVVKVDSITDSGAVITVSGLPAAPPPTLPTRGTSRADTFKGTAKANTFFGLGGNDTILGLGGNDTLDGGTGADTIRGGTGNDRIVGGKGKDKLFGDAGNDTLLANDRSRGDSLKCGAGRDIVRYDRGDNVARDCEVRRLA